MEFSMRPQNEFMSVFNNKEDNINSKTIVETQEVESAATKEEFVKYYHGTAWVSVLSVILILVMLLTIGGNLLVLFAFGMHKKMRTKSNLFLLNLAVADFLVGLLAMPFSLVTLIKGTWVFGHAMCQVNGFIEGITLTASIHTIMHMAIYEYIRLTRPMSEIITKQKVGLMLLASWLLPFLFTVAVVSGWTKITYKIGATQCGPVIPKTASQYSQAITGTICNLLLPFMVVIFCYGKIHKEAMRHYNRMQERGMMDTNFFSSRRRNTCITVVAIIVCFLICWAPYLLYANFVIFFPNSVKLPHIINPVAYLFGYMNSACNPIIYALRNPDLRKIFQQFLRRKKETVQVATPKINVSEVTNSPTSDTQGNV